MWLIVYVGPVDIDLSYSFNFKFNYLPPFIFQGAHVKSVKRPGLVVLDYLKHLFVPKLVSTELTVVRRTKNGLFFCRNVN